MKVRVIAAAALVLLGLVAVWLLRGGDHPAAPTTPPRGRNAGSPVDAPTLTGRVPADEPRPRSPSAGAGRDGQSTADTSRAGEDPAYDIGGRVLAAGTKSPIEGATVYCLPKASMTPWRSTGIFSGTSDGNGRFTVRGVPPGTWLLFAVHPDHVNPTLSRHLVERASGTSGKEERATPYLVTVPGRDGEVLHVEIRMPDGPVLAGRVVDPDGQPVPDAEIQCANLRYVDIAYRLDVMALGRIRPLPLTTTDEQGRFRLACLPAALGVAVLGARHPRHAGIWSDEIPIAKGQDHENLVLKVEPMATVEGHVRFDDGEPAPRARVRVLGPKRAWISPDPVETDDEGGFRLPSVPPGPFRVHAQVEEPVPLRAMSESLELAPGEIRKGVEIVIARRRTTTGCLRDEEGRPLTGERVEAGRPEPDDPEDVETLAGALTADDGCFVLDLEPGLRVDLYHVSPRRERRLAESVLTPATDLALVSTATPLHRVQLRVLLPDGSPLPFFRARIRAERRARLSSYRKHRHTVMGRDGRASLEALDGPPLHLRISKFRDRRGRELPLDTVEQKLEEVPDDVLEIRLRARGEVRGIVVDDEGGPVGNASVRVGFDREPIPVKTDGTFHVTGIPSGRDVVTVHLEVPRGFCAVRGRRVRLGGEPVRFVLTPGGTIRGRVTAPVPVDMEGWPVVATWDDLTPSEAGMTSAEVGADGTFTLEGIPDARDVSITVAERDAVHGIGLYAEWVEGIRAGATDVVIPLREGRQILGRVIDPDGRLELGSSLTVEAFDAEGARLRWTDVDVTDQGAAFELPALPPGPCRVRLELEGRLVLEVEDVPAGTPDLLMRLPPFTRIAGRVHGLPPGEKARVAARRSAWENAQDEDLIVITDEDGAFTIEAVPAGHTWTLTATARDHGLVGVTKPVAAGGTEVGIRLQEGLTIEGRLRRKGGGPPPRRFLRAIGGGQLAFGWSEDDGSFRLGPLLSGTYRIVQSGVSPRMSDIAMDDVSAGARDLEILLP